MTVFVSKIAQEFSLKDQQVDNSIRLLFEEECTIPFVCRYRKEMTGSLDETTLRGIRDRYQYLTELDELKQRYLKVVEQHCKEKPELQNKWSELKAKFESCETKNELEDLYLPFKPKRRTKAMIAKEKGLEALLDKLLEQAKTLTDLDALAAEFVTWDNQEIAPALRVKTAEDALTGASDIYAERIAEQADYRSLVRDISNETGMLVSKKLDIIDKPIEGALPEEPRGKKSKPKKDKSAKYENYFDYSEPLSQAASHRIMAVRRGEAERVLKMSIEVDKERVVGELKEVVLGAEPCTDCVKAWIEKVVDDSYKRLIGPSIETELRLQLKTKAEQDAIKVFSDNLENLLLLPPIPGKTVLGVDPGIRTGSKLAVVDDTGKLLDHATIYPHITKMDDQKTLDAQEQIRKFLETYDVQYVAIGNGTGNREVGKVITAVLKSDDKFKFVKKLVVNEAGASVYSTDEVALEEFPDLDPTIRSAVSIARRLQDPLAELVKIDPRSIGVGQYQHDVNPTKLGKSLGDVVESCVNRVGVNINTASHKLLDHVSGIGPSLAKAIVRFRETEGKIQSREQLLKITGFGPKAYQQAAGFIRVPESQNPLDNSAVHPESYVIVERMAKDQGKEVRDMIGNAEAVKSLSLENFVDEKVGMPTLIDITAELVKPGRDPREDGSRLIFSDDVNEIEDLKVGMSLPGTVTNVTNFGAFVDVGVHQDGLVHISELSDEFVSDPTKVVSVGQVVNARVIEVDIARRRISLSLKSKDAATARPQGSGEKRQFAKMPPRGQRPQGGRSGEREARGPKNYRGGSNRKPRQDDDKNYTLEDLMAKFNKR